MDWNVKNAISRDVERQHLNKILAEIRAAIDVVDKKAVAAAASSNIEDVVGKMVEGNVETGVSVTYDAAKKLLDFVVSSFTLTLAGDVEGAATITGLGNVTLTTALAEGAGGVEEAPIDNHFYWRQNAMWQPVRDSIVNFETLKGTGFAAQHQDDGESIWELRELEVETGELTVSNPAGEAGNPLFGLADVTDTGTGDLVGVTIDSKGRVIGTRDVDTDDLEEGVVNLYSRYYRHDQPGASATWTVNHNAGRAVQVQVFTTGGVQMLAEVVHINNNQAQILFDGAYNGYAIVD